jgi:hypothetical protein
MMSLIVEVKMASLLTWDTHASELTNCENKLAEYVVQWGWDLQR